MTSLAAAGTYQLADRTVHRMGYGAMQLAGKGVFGPPRDRAEAVAVLRAAVEAGVDHIDTSDFYGPHITNEIIREALHPYPANLTIVTKLGARRGEDASWNPAFSRDQLTAAVHDNIRNLGVEAIEVANLRLMFGHVGPAEGSIEAPLNILADLQCQGLIRHIGLSNVTPTQLAEGRRIAEIACVQNAYNLAHRDDDAMIDGLAADGIAYVPFFPPGRLHPAPVRHVIGRRRAAERDTDAGRARLAPPPRAQHPPNPGYVVGGAFAGEPGGGGAEAGGG